MLSRAWKRPRRHSSACSRDTTLGKRLSGFPDAGGRLKPTGHPAISDATSRGCDSIATWLAATSTTAALRRLAILRCRAGWMARSFVATRYRHVLPRHAGTDTVPPNAAPAIGDWAA